MNKFQSPVFLRIAIASPSVNFSAYRTHNGGHRCTVCLEVSMPSSQTVQTVSLLHPGRDRSCSEPSGQGTGRTWQADTPHHMILIQPLVPSGIVVILPFVKKSNAVNKENLLTSLLVLLICLLVLMQVSLTTSSHPTFSLIFSVLSIFFGSFFPLILFSKVLKFLILQIYLSPLL